MSGKSYKPVKVETTVQGALDFAREELEALADECDEAYNNFPNQDHPKAQAFSEAASELQNISGLDDDLPESLHDLSVVYHESVPRRRSHNPSKSSRRDNAVSALNAVVSVLTDLENPTDEDAETAASMVSNCEDAMSYAEGVEFPGMFG